MEMSFGPAFWALIAVSALGAAAYGLFFLNRGESALRAAVKTVFMGAMAAAFYVANAPPLLLWAVAASAAGDLLLAFNRRWLLPFGILAFLLAQLTYLTIFAALWFFSGDLEPLSPRYIAMAAIVAVTAGFLIWMTPRLKWLALAVIPYALAITAMACMAMWLPWIGWAAMLGALLFLTSDFVLATELFHLSPDAPARRFTAPIVWWTYAAAQALIVYGILVVALSD
ncbi:MAG: lysoplasmalogenase family protein [Hyphomonadaceae bacterium]